MKKIYFLVFLLWQATAIAQDTTGYDLLAHYPFQTDATDATGNNADATVVNSPITNGSIYSNGIYYDASTGQNGSSIVMNGISNFNPDDFIITFEAKLSSNSFNYLFVCGVGYRWLSILADNSNLLRVEYLYGANADFGYHTTSLSLLTDQWYQFGIKYSQSDHNLYIYVDNNLVDTINVPDGFTTNNEFIFSNTHGGYGIAFYGYWRNVKYYKPQSSNIFNELMSDYINIRQSEGGLLNINLQKEAKANISVFDITGKVIVRQKLNFGNNVVNLSDVSNGIYIINFEVNNLKFTKKIIKF